MAPRLRVLAFGSAAALVVAGSICAVLVGGLTGEVLAIALITSGGGNLLWRAAAWPLAAPGPADSRG